LPSRLKVGNHPSTFSFAGTFSGTAQKVTLQVQTLKLPFIDYVTHRLVREMKGETGAFELDS